MRIVKASAISFWRLKGSLIAFSKVTLVSLSSNSFYLRLKSQPLGLEVPQILAPMEAWDIILSEQCRTESVTKPGAISIKTNNLLKEWPPIFYWICNSAALAYMIRLVTADYKLTLAFEMGLPLDSSLISTVEVMISACIKNHFSRHTKDMILKIYWISEFIRNTQ